MVENRNCTCQNLVQGPSILTRGTTYPKVMTLTSETFSAEEDPYCCFEQKKKELIEVSSKVPTPSERHHDLLEGKDNQT